MDVIITPQAAADAGCRATVASYRDYSDEYKTPDSTIQRFDGRFPILNTVRTGKWFIKSITVQWEKEDATGNRYEDGYVFESPRFQFGDTVDFFELYRDMHPDQSYWPIAKSGFFPSIANATWEWWFEWSPEHKDRETYNLLSITVKFEEEEYDDILIRTLASPTGAGTTTGDGLYSPGSSVTIKATSNSGYVFLNWTKDGKVVSNNSTYSFIASEDARYVAVFEEASRKYTIKTSADPAVGGITSGDGRYSRGEPVTIRAVANPGYKFHVWKKGVLVVAGGSGIYGFSAKEDAEYVAVFKPCGIIYDPSSGKIMYDANAGSILCYT